MITLVLLLVLEIVLVGYIASRIVRHQATPTPTLRAATLTASALLLTMLSVTEPFEVVMRGPAALTVWGPTLLKHLGILGCGAGVLLMTLAQRQLHRAAAEMAVWLWFSASAVAVVVLHIVAGGGGQRTSVEYVEWSHTQPLLVAAMLVSYVGGLAASIGVLAVIWPLHLRSSAGRGLAIMALGALLSAGWCFMRLRYLGEAVASSSTPQDGDFLITQLLSLSGVLMLTIGLVWSTAEADVSAWSDWRQFRALNWRVLEVVPEVRRGSDRRLGFDTWVSDRAIEVLDGLHQIERISGVQTGFPRAPERVSNGEMTAVVADLGRQYGDRRTI